MVENLTLLTDFYELTMMQGYFKSGKDPVVVFDVFYRSNPSGNGFAIACGLDQVIDYIKNLNFSYEDVEYLRSMRIFDEEFLDYLLGFHFTGDIYAVPEGTVIFPMEPIVKVVAPITQAQMIESAILNLINHQSLIATKAARVCYAAQGEPVLEFGLRRAQGPDAGVLGARAAVIGGCVGTSNVLCGKKFDVPVLGTHAHSWIMSFPDELTAFTVYADLFPQNVTLLVDTYDTLRSGVPNAVKIFSKLREEGRMPEKYGIRIDSGDLSYLSKKARAMLDEAGFQDAAIVASSDLDETIISSLKTQKSAINQWGVGTKLITSADCPAFGGVYKLAAMQGEDGEFVPKIKLSENTWKITNPGNKTIFRIYDEHGKIKADLIAFADETVSENEELVLFDPIETWKKTILSPGEFTVKEILKPVFKQGQCVYTSPSVMEIREYCKAEMNTLWEESRRLVNPHEVYVDLTERLWNTKKKLLDEYNESLQTSKHASQLK